MGGELHNLDNTYAHIQPLWNYYEKFVLLPRACAMSLHVPRALPSASPVEGTHANMFEFGGEARPHHPMRVHACVCMRASFHRFPGGLSLNFRNCGRGGRLFFSFFSF